MSLGKKLNHYTQLSSAQRKKSMKWISNQNEELLLLAFEKQKDYFLNLSKIGVCNSYLLSLASFYLSVGRLYDLQYVQKSKVLSTKEMKDITKMRVLQFKRSRKTEKYDKLLSLKKEIIFLIDLENLSFRGVSKFLKKYYKFEVSHSYIATFYKNMKDA